MTDDDPLDDPDDWPDTDDFDNDLDNEFDGGQVDEDPDQEDDTPSIFERVTAPVDWVYETFSFTQQLFLLVGILVFGVVMMAIGLGWTPTTSDVIFIGVMAGAGAAGLLGIPAFIFLFGKSLPLGVVTRILWTIATLAQGGMILRHEENGEYQAYAPERDADGTVYIQTPEGRVDVGTPSGHWFRLGKKQFGITYQKTEGMFGNLLADLDDEYLAEDPPQEDTHAYADGGQQTVALLDMVRGGYQAFSRHVGKTQGDGSWILRADKAASRKRGAGGRGQAGKAKEQTLKEHGGNTAAMAGKWFYIAFLGALTVGAFSSYLAMGM